MPIARIACRAQLGLLAPPVQIEVHLGNGLPMFNIVGLPAAAVKESKERVRAALANTGFELPAGRITVNLAPADLPKDGGRFDLAIAVGIVLASGQLVAHDIERYEIYGELGLSGELRAAPGLLLAAVQAAAAGRDIILPLANAAELTAAPLAAVHRRIRPAANLTNVCEHLSGAAPLADLHSLSASSESAHPANSVNADQVASAPDLGDLVGQAPAKRALIVAAAGGHSLLLVGPPGCGKSMLAQRLPGLLPPLTSAEQIEVASIRSVCGVPATADDFRRRPFRAPHHTASATAIVGGGPHARPGEITLAHGGVLFLDELPEYDRRVREALREPLETGVVAITRAGAHCEYPARFQLIAAMNPCECGHLGDPSGRCRCTPNSVQRYRSRISGPLLDRIDLCVQLTRVVESEWEHGRDRLALANNSINENSARAAEKIATARTRQLSRAGVLNAALDATQTGQFARMNKAAEKILLAACAKLQLSARAKQRVTRVARTIADLENSDTVDHPHVAEALQWRSAS